MCIYDTNSFLKVPYNYTYFDFPTEITLQTDRVIFESIFEQTKNYIFEPDLNWKWNWSMDCFSVYIQNTAGKCSFNIYRIKFGEETKKVSGVTSSIHPSPEKQSWVSFSPQKSVDVKGLTISIKFYVSDFKNFL